MAKQKIMAIVEFTDNNLCAYLKDIDGIIGIGNDMKEVKESLQKSVELHKALCEEEGFVIEPELADEYEIDYKYDMASFLHIYGGILSKSGLENLTGINQKQLWHYANGKNKPRKNTVDKIESAIHNFAKELQEIEFA